MLLSEHLLYIRYVGGEDLEEIVSYMNWRYIEKEHKKRKMLRYIIFYIAEVWVSRLPSQMVLPVEQEQKLNF